MAYSAERKAAVLKKVLPPKNVPLRQLSREEGIGEATLHSWRQTARGKGGRQRVLRGASITAAARPVGTVVCVHANAMREPWCLPTSKTEVTTRKIINHYARRWVIEPGFRDTKDLRSSMGLGAVRIGGPERRDRLLLLNAFAVLFLTLLGADGEALGVNATSRSTLQSAEPIPSSASAACSTTSSWSCPNPASGHCSTSSSKFYKTNIAPRHCQT